MSQLQNVFLRIHQHSTLRDHTCIQKFDGFDDDKRFQLFQHYSKHLNH
jgi:hypothetical protein